VEFRLARVGRPSPGGYGWGAFWLTSAFVRHATRCIWFPRHAHNAYLQIMVNLGLVELAIVVAIGLVALRRAASLVGRHGLAGVQRAGRRCWWESSSTGVAESAFAMPRDMVCFAATACSVWSSAAIIGVGSESLRAQYWIARPARALSAYRRK